MYTAFFGLQKPPFKMPPDPAILFPTVHHREGLAGLAYAIMSRKGLMVLTGDAGTGKTTLMAKILDSLPAPKVRSSVILHPTVTANEFLEMVLLDFGLPHVAASKAQRLRDLRNFLLLGHKAGQISVLIVDEAHKLTPELLEEIRLLGNFECEDKLLQVVLMGQNELDGTLNREDLRQFKQRIAFHWRLWPLSDAETDAYIRYRWSKAGGPAAVPFTAEAIAAVTQYSRNIPRLINTICDNALLAAFSDGSRLVEAAHIQEAATDVDARRGLTSPAPVGNRPVPAQQPLRPPVRVPQFCDTPEPKPSLLTKWAARFRLARVNGMQ